jgi:uncharacterized protein YaaN involved in tellurite resistance
MVDELQRSIEDLQRILSPLRQGEFKELLDKISVYVQSVQKNRDALCSTLKALEKMRADDLEEYHKAVDAKVNIFRASMQNLVRFAYINLDASLMLALEALVWRPKNSTKTDEQKKANALQKTFDRLDNPIDAMLEHYHTSSDPLNKYLVAGQWGHEYLRKRKIALDEYDQKLCDMLGAQETVPCRFLLSYATLSKAIDDVEKQARIYLERETPKK